MKVLLATLLILSGCANVVYDRPPSNMDSIGPWMGPHNDEVDRVNALRAKLLPPLHLYRPSEEQPRMVKVGFNVVSVYERSCYQGPEPKTVLTSDYSASIYLCGKRFALPHEFAHTDGMKHTEWEQCGGGKCAQVTQADRAGKYKVGDWIFVANGYEWVE